MMQVQVVGHHGVGKSAVAWQVAAVHGWPLISLGSIFRGLANYTDSITELLLMVENLVIIPADPARNSRQTILVGADCIHTDERDLKAESATGRLSSTPRLVQKLMSSVERQLPRDCIIEGRFSPELLGSADTVIELTASLSSRASRLKAESARAYAGDPAAWLLSRNFSDNQELKVRLLGEMRWHVVCTEGRKRFETVAAVNELMERAATGRKVSLSVIIPARNESAHLPDLIDEVDRQARQDQVDAQVVVIDDGSTDETTHAACNAQVIRTPPRGRAAARNSGLAAAQGDIALFLDADTLPFESFLLKARDLHTIYYNAVVVGPRQNGIKAISGVTGADFIIQRDSREVVLDRYGYDLNTYPSPWIFAYTCNMSMSRELAQSTRFDEGFDGWGIEDIEFAYRVSIGSRSPLWVFDPGRRVLHFQRRSDDAGHRFSQWRKNLLHAQSKHGAAAMAPISNMEPLLNPAVKADLLETAPSIYGSPNQMHCTKVPREWLPYAPAMQDGSGQRVYLAEDVGEVDCAQEFPS